MRSLGVPAKKGFGHLWMALAPTATKLRAWNDSQL
jgi:hypothetical protein